MTPTKTNAPQERGAWQNQSDYSTENSTCLLDRSVSGIGWTLAPSSTWVWGAR